MDGQLFTVMAVTTPKKKEIEEEGTLSRIVLQPLVVVARDDKDAAIKVVMNSPELKDIDQDRLEVVVVPFR